MSINDDRLDEVLSAWHAAADAGRELSLAALCKDCPELLAEAERRVAALRYFRDVADPPTTARPDSEPSVAPPSPPLAAPALEFPGGRYHVVGEVARGGMGVVLRVADTTLDRPLAVKLLLPGATKQPGAEDRFLLEARITGGLQHPNIPPVHEVGRLADGRPFFSMKLIQGRTFAALLRERPSPRAELPRFLGIFQQVCQGVAFAHAQGVIHRDLKPLNVMVGAFGEVQVMDWGLAKRLGPGGLLDSVDLAALPTIDWQPAADPGGETPGRSRRHA
jgi:serine/threonine protein kinase